MLRTVAGFLLSTILAAYGLTALATATTFTTSTTITEPTPAFSDGFGFSDNDGGVISADGSTILVGVPFEPTDSAGRAYFYRASLGKWSMIQEVTDPDTTANDNFGISYALSAEGNTALIASAAAVSGHAGAGKVYVYSYSGGAWTKTHEFDDPAANANDAFGDQLALSADGTVAVLGAPGDTSGEGKVYFYAYSGGQWTLADAFGDPESSLSLSDNFGETVAISANGQSVLVTDAAGTGGKVYLYTESFGSWSQAQVFTDPGATAGDAFGSDISMSSSGDTAAISAEGAGSGAGEVYVFSDSSGSWSQTGALTDPDATANDGFGNPVSLSAAGNTLLAGSSAAVGGVANAGKAYLYILNTGTWGQSQEFDDPADSTGDYFGGSGLSLTEDGLNAYIAASGTKVGSVASAGAGYLLQTQTNLTLGYNSTPVSSVTVGDSFTLDYEVGDGGSFSGGDSRLVLTLPSGVSFVSGTDCSAGGSKVICGEFLVTPGVGGWTAAITLKATAPGKMDILAEAAAEEAASSLSNSSFDTAVTVADVAPTAKAGSVTTAEGQAVSGTLTASVGYTGQKLSYAVATQPAHGSVTVTAATGAFTYTPDSGYSGSDSFTFTAGDGTVSSSAATESITIDASGSGTSSGGSGALSLLSLTLLGTGLGLRRRRPDGA